jgi:Mg-chelatase subunit ChlD
MSIPSEFICPISMDLMTDPVVGTDGHTYERTAITEWLSTNTVSPLTRQPMSLSNLQTNFALRTAIERWRLSNEPAPNPLPQLIPDTKTLTVKAIKQGDQSVLDINTTHTTAMETIAIAVLDVSGSMNSPASSSRSSEGANFSRLDLVKHSMKTLATLFNSKPDTSLGIITFSNAAKQVLPITKMDQLGLNLALKEIDNLVVEGATNIWDGLRLAFQQADNAMNSNPNANIQILLLTDGEPTTSMLPPLGIKNTLTRKLKSLKGKVTISTFGFGYSLDCELLESISLLGNGSYGFIPDCSMVGTVFINWATRALLTLAHHITVTIQNTTYNVGDLLLGQSQRILVPSSDSTTATITYDNGQQCDTQVQVEDGDIIDDIYLNRFQQILEKIKSCKSSRDCQIDELKVFKYEISGLPQSVMLQAIAKDIESDDDGEGQITKACSKETWWVTWGRSHCIAYYQALKLRQCINFKDKVLQLFTSQEFMELQEAGIDIFSNIPAPKPSPIYEGSYYPGAPNSGYINPNPSVPASIFSSDIRTVNIMSNYVSSSGPCFTGDCKVRMEDNTTKNVENLHKGDKVLGGHTVAAILYTPVQNTVEMVAFESGLKITPWHPMKLTNSSPWVFPNDTDGTKQNMYVEAYYNIVLESGHIVELNGYQVVTLGHGFTDNEVITHPYFGTDLILNDLKRHPGFRTGFIVMNPKNIVRNINSGLIEKI